MIKRCIKSRFVYGAKQPKETILIKVPSWFWKVSKSTNFESKKTFPFLSPQAFMSINKCPKLRNYYNGANRLLETISSKINKLQINTKNLIGKPSKKLKKKSEKLTIMITKSSPMLEQQLCGSKLKETFITYHVLVELVKKKWPNPITEGIFVQLAI